MSGWYLDGKEALLSRTIPAEAGVFVCGVNDQYTFFADDKDFSELTPHILLPEQQLQNVTFTKGVLDADDVKWIAAGAGINDRSLTLTGVVVYFKLDDVGSLLAYIDSAVVGLPSLLTGVNVTARWNSLGILAL